MTTRIRHSAFWLLVGLLAGLLSACTAPATAAPTPMPSATPQPSPTPFAPQQLRVKNGGATEIKGLKLSFGTDWIAFGNLAPGATTDYQVATKGVLGYAAYAFEMDGRVVEQPVVDFMSEQWLPGSAFTYIVDYDPARYSQNQAIKLLNVSTDIAASGPTPTAAPQYTSFNAQVELDVFSGKPNPTWTLSPPEINALQANWAFLSATAEQPYPDRLGYRGLIVTFTDPSGGTGPITWRVWTGIAQISTGTTNTYYADPNQTLENWLLETGQPFLSADLLATVQAARPPNPHP